MDKKLILKAVKAVMDFNEYHSDSYAYSASIDIGMHSVWVRVFKFGTQDMAVYILNNTNATDADIKDFIQKLDELKAV
ncbi:MAG: hypothetical protein J6S68_14250 [Acinetobacter sp.]|nr:hypothetical protein [Acinetobacter sp.]